MFCGNCGAQMQDGDKFCGVCGAVVETAEAPARGATGTQPPKKQPKLPRNLIGIAVGVIAVVLVVVLVASLFGGNAVTKAMVKSAGAYTDAAAKLDLPQVGGLLEEGTYSADVSLWIEEMPDSYYSALEGAGVRADLDLSLAKENLALTLTPYIGSADIMNIQAKVSGDYAYVGAPEMLGETLYSVNTTTLGADLVAMELLEDDFETLGFNLFNVIAQLQEISAMDENVTKAVTKAAKQLGKEIEIDKTGKETIDVNDNDVKCTVYHVIIPQDAIETFLGAVEDAMKEVDNTDAYEALLESMGLPADDVMDEMGMDDMDMGDTFDELEEVLDILEDIELDVYLNGGYIMSVTYENKIEGTKVEVALDLGGGDNYVDDLSLTMEVGGENSISFVSTGNHAAKGGEFTDESTLEVEEYGYAYEVLSSEMTYKPGGKEENFDWTMEMDGVVFELNGHVSGGKNELNIALDEVSINSYGSELVLGVECVMGSYKADSISTKNSVEVLKLSEDELMDLGEDLSGKIMDWAEDIYSEHGELIDSLDYLF